MVIKYNTREVQILEVNKECGNRTKQERIDVQRLQGGKHRVNNTKRSQEKLFRISGSNRRSNGETNHGRMTPCRTLRQVNRKIKGCCVPGMSGEDCLQLYCRKCHSGRYSFKSCTIIQLLRT